MATSINIPKYKMFNSKQYVAFEHSAKKFPKSFITQTKKLYHLKGVRQVKVGSYYVLYVDWM